jgi:hypothetical protein
MTGMLAGLLVMLYVRLGTNIAWTWYVLIGTSATFLTAVLVSLLVPESEMKGMESRNA